MTDTKKLLELMLKNPELKVVPFVHQDCCSDDYNYTVANLNSPRVDEYYYYGDGIYFKSDLGELIEKVWEDIEDPEATEEDAEEIVKTYVWERAIFIDIDA